MLEVGDSLLITELEMDFWRSDLEKVARGKMKNKNSYIYIFCGGRLWVGFCGVGLEAKI